MRLQRFVDFIRIFSKNAVQCRLVDSGIIQRLNVIVFRIAEVYDRILERQCALLIGIGAGNAVAAVDLCFNEVLLTSAIVFS